MYCTSSNVHSSDRVQDRWYPDPITPDTISKAPGNSEAPRVGSSAASQCPSHLNVSRLLTALSLPPWIPPQSAPPPSSSKVRFLSTPDALHCQSPLWHPGPSRPGTSQMGEGSHHRCQPLPSLCDHRRDRRLRESVGFLLVRETWAGFL